MLADEPRSVDITLLRIVANAQNWFEQLKLGKTFVQIASDEQASKRPIQQMIELAFLTPEMICEVMNGEQPMGFTSDWCLRHSIPSAWSDQRPLLATL